MIGTTDSEAATFNMLGAVPVPQETPTYTPLPYPEYVSLVKDAYASLLDLQVTEEEYCLARNGARMFGVIKFRPERAAIAKIQHNPEYTFSVIVRSSYDRSMSNAFGHGANVTVCSNGIFSANGMTAFSKHTKNLHSTLESRIAMGVVRAKRDFVALGTDITGMKQIGLTCDLGFAFLGMCRGRGVMNPTQFNRASEYWLKPPHREHQERSLWSVYNAVNHSLKTSKPVNALNGFTGLHQASRAFRSTFAQDFKGLVIDQQVIDGTWEVANA
jgi:hypothetical protein